MNMKDRFERVRACDIRRGDVIDIAPDRDTIKPRQVVSVVPFMEVINLHFGLNNFTRHEYNDVILVIERAEDASR